MSEILRDQLHQAVSRTNGCPCSHAGTFSVEEVVNGHRKTLAVETFDLQGNPEASRAFAWSWNDGKERGYIAVLGVPGVDSPEEAVRSAMQDRARDSYGLTESICGMLPGTHVKVIPCSPTMHVACDFEFLDHYTVFRPSGEMFFHEAVSLISESLSFASFLNFERLLIDAVRLTGFPSPNAWQRFWMASEWAAVGKGLRLAVVARAEMIDPLYFGVAVARDRGLFANVFSSEREAVEWLLHPKSP